MKKNLEKIISGLVISLISLLVVFLIVAIIVKKPEFNFIPKKETEPTYSFATDETSDIATKDEAKVDFEEKDVVIRDVETTTGY